MKNHATLRLSFWAKNHRSAAIVSIVAAKITIGGLGLLLGTWAAVEGLLLPLQVKWLLAAIAATSILAYPTKSMKKRLGQAAFYRRQKATDGVLVGLGFIILFFVGNLAPAWVAVSNTAAHLSANVPIALSCLEKPTVETRKEIVRGGKLPRWIAAKVKAKAGRILTKLERVASGSDTTLKVLLTILLVIATVVLLRLVAGLACNLSCSGQESAALLVVIFGTSAVIAGAIFAIRAVWKRSGGNDLDDRHRKRKIPTGR